jgi:hypothetical protein
MSLFIIFSSNLDLVESVMANNPHEATEVARKPPRDDPEYPELIASGGP